MMRSIKRRGFTLVELLVVTGLIVFLAAVAMLTVPGIMQKNRTVDASTQVDVWLQISRARAQRDKLPRGLRLIIDTNDPINKPAPAPGAVDQRLFVTEVQYIEAPPVFVANPNPPYPNGLLVSALQPHPLSPRVEFVYTVSVTGTGPQPPGTLYDRQCVIRGLTQEQATQITSGPTASSHGSGCRLLGTWHQITTAIQTTPPLLAPDDNSGFLRGNAHAGAIPGCTDWNCEQPGGTPRPPRSARTTSASISRRGRCSASRRCSCRPTRAST